MSVQSTPSTTTQPILPQVVEGAKVCMNHLSNIVSEAIGPVSKDGIVQSLGEVDQMVSKKVDVLTNGASEWVADPENKGYVNKAKLIAVTVLLILGISNLTTILIGGAAGIYFKDKIKAGAAKVQEVWNNQSSAVKAATVIMGTVLAVKVLPITMMAALIGGAMGAITLSDYVSGQQAAANEANAQQESL